MSRIRITLCVSVRYERAFLCFLCNLRYYFYCYFYSICDLKKC